MKIYVLDYLSHQEYYADCKDAYIAAQLYIKYGDYLGKYPKPTLAMLDWPQKQILL